MKICFVVGTLGRGGAERQLLYMLRVLTGQGIEARLLCLTQGEAFESAVREMGVGIECVGKSRSRISRFRTIIKAVRSFAPDIVQSTHFYTNLYSAVAAKLAGKRSIGAIRSDLTREIPSRFSPGRAQIMLPDLLIANTETAVRRAVSFGVSKRRIDVVRNVVEFPVECENSDSTRGRGLLISFVGRLVKEKRPELFVRMAGKLKERFPGDHLRFRVVGEGPMRSSLEDLSDSLGLSAEEMDFAGEQANMLEVYEETDILVLTSDSEGSPNVLLEAMYCGIPVVATRVGGVVEILDGDNGILVEPGSLDELVKGTERLIADDELRELFGQRGETYVRANHSFDYLEGRLQEIYGRLLGEWQR